MHGTSTPPHQSKRNISVISHGEVYNVYCANHYTNNILNTSIHQIEPMQSSFKWI